MSFFFSSRRRHTRWTGDWSSDVCSSDLHIEDHQRKQFVIVMDRYFDIHGNILLAAWNRERRGNELAVWLRETARFARNASKRPRAVVRDNGEREEQDNQHEQQPNQTETELFDELHRFINLTEK